MKSLSSPKLLSANFDLTHDLLQVQQAVLDCKFAVMALQIAGEESQLATIHYQQVQVDRALNTRSCSSTPALYKSP